MIIRIIFLVTICLLTSNLVGAALPKASAAQDPLQTKPDELHAVYGKVTYIDRATRSITVALGTRFTFHVPAEAQIKIRKGAVVDFGDIRLGEGAEIVARRSAESWTAVKIWLDPKAN